jgi:RNA polymerase sigma factor (sigma-70 family)
MRAKILPLRDGDEIRDEALLSSVAAGDGEALGTLFDRHHVAVERFVGRLALCDAEELADLVQTTFIEVRRSARRFVGGSSVKTWIFGIAANLARHHVRGELRRRGMLATVSRRPAARVAVPDEAAIRRQLLSRLADALAGLPLQLREAFVLCDIEGLPGAGAARALGVREGTLWWRLHEARKRLRDAVEGVP